jgi:hypothetical protein
MAEQQILNPTMLDLAKRSDPDNKIATIVELLNQTNEVNLDMTWMEGNLPTGHRTTVRTGIPVPTWRKLYGGTQPGKSLTAQIEAKTGMLEAYAEIDKALADLNGNTSAFRLSEEMAFIEGMNQEMADTIFFGNEGTEPEAFTGLSPLYNDLSAENADNIVLGGGTGADNRSIWLVVWGPRTVHGIVPKGSTAGLQVTDKGQVTIEDADGSNGRMEAYRTHYRWDAGLVLRDWRFCVRIANIDFSDLTADAATGANLPDLMYDALRLIPNMGSGRPAFYAARDVWSFFGKQLANATSGSTLSIENVGGVFTERWHGIPLRRVDRLAVNEALVV